MVRGADAVVVGAGILGASVAHFLMRKGFGKVVLLEKNTICSGATAYSAANVRQCYSNEVAIRLAVRGLEMFRNAEEELGGSAGFVSCGYMVIAPDAQRHAIEWLVPLQQSLGATTEIVSPEAIHELYPQLDLDGVALGALERDSGYADPVRTVASLIGSAREMGMRLYEHTEVIDVTLDDGAVTGVVTERGAVEAPVVVNAAGPWAARIGAMVGIDYRLSLSREHEAVFALPDGFGPFPIVSDPANGIYLRPYGSDRVLVGEGYPKEQEPCDPDTYDDRADAPVVARMLERLGKRVPALADARLVGDYAGVYSITDDWYPLVGAEPEIEGYFAAVGGSGHCFKIGPPIGEALADVIAGREPEIDISGLARSRFRADALFSSAWGPGNRA